MNVGKMIYGVIGLIITLFLISGGLSGTLVLRGTNSSQALVVVALIFLVFDLVYIFSAYREGEVKSKPVESKNEIKADNVNAAPVVAKSDNVKSVSTGETGISVTEFKVGGGKTSFHFEKPHTIDEKFSE